MEQRTSVVITDVDMPFMSMVNFMVKWALASIPALLILGVLGFVLGLFFAGVSATLQEHPLLLAVGIAAVAGVFLLVAAIGKSG